MKVSQIKLTNNAKKNLCGIITNMRKEAKVTKRKFFNRTEFIQEYLVNDNDGQKIASIKDNNLIMHPKENPNLSGSCIISYYDNEYIVDTMSGKIMPNPLSNEKNNSPLSDVKNALETIIHNFNNHENFQKIKSAICWG